MTGQVQKWVGGVVAGAALVGLAVYLAVVGLDEADKWASVLSLFVGLVGLGVAVAGTRRDRPAPGGQSVEGSVVGGGIAQVAGTGGNVTITHRGTNHTAPPSPGPVPPPTASPPDGGQRVRDTTTSGPVDQVRDTGGNVGIEEGP